uniref:Uncharacterized protein n=1 Tax=Pristionchus pacificus TaxID=54126 RepID=A0A8R1Z0I8_PRIPA
SSIDSVFEWSKEWNLPLNETKCTVHRRLISDILFLHKSIHGFYSYDRTNLFKLSPLALFVDLIRIVLPYSLPKSHSNFVTRAIDRWNVLSAEFVHSSPSNFRSHILSLPSISFTSDSLLRLYYQPAAPPTPHASKPNRQHDDGPPPKT